jgi:hypothetical protein
VLELAEHLQFLLLMGHLRLLNLQQALYVAEVHSHKAALVSILSHKVPR